MNSLIYPEFCSKIAEKWPFPVAMPHISLCYCYFDKELFVQQDYQDTSIALPDYLNSAINKRKAEYLAGRLCAKEALVKLGHNAYPTSYEDKSPCWPEFICGSISHSNQLAAAIVGRAEHWQAMGLDIEKKLEFNRSLRLMPVVLNKAEQALITDHSKTDLFVTLAFSIKESLFKALFPLTKKRFYFEDAQIISASKDGKITLQLLKNLSEQWPKGCEIQGQFCVLDNYVWTLVAIAQ